MNTVTLAEVNAAITAFTTNRWTRTTITSKIKLESIRSSTSTT